MFSTTVQSLTSHFYHFQNEEQYFSRAVQREHNFSDIPCWLLKEASRSECTVLLLLAALDPVNVWSSSFIFRPSLGVLVNPL